MNSGKLSQFSSQLATLLVSGVPLLDAIKLLQGQNQAPNGTKLIRYLSDGNRLAVSLEKAGYPQFFITFIQAAEERGDYVTGLRQCYSYYYAADRWLSGLRQTTFYPMVTMILIMLALLLIINMLVPQFMLIYSSMNMKLPVYTSIFITVYGWFTATGYILLTFICFLIFALLAWRKHIDWSSLMFKIPGLKQWIQYRATHFFSLQLGYLLQGGVPLVRALYLLQKISPWPSLARQFYKIRKSLINGQPLSQALSNSRLYILPATKQIVVIGELTGQMDKLLLGLAQTCEDVIKNKTERFIKILEPILLLVIGGLVAATILVLFLPILQLVKTI